MSDVQTAETTKADDGLIRCDACPVLCRIRPGKTGACDRYANVDGVLTRTDPLVLAQRAIDRDGKLLETWSNDFTAKVGFDADQYKDTAHGLYWSRESGGEFFYWTENKSTNKTGPKFGSRVYKTDLNGKVLYTLGPGVKATSNSAPFDFVSPTDVAVARGGLGSCAVEMH